MATKQPAASAALRATFRLFANGERVIAQNPDGKLIDVGAMETKGDRYTVRLDVDPLDLQPSHSVDAALRAVSSQLNFDYLDGLFTSEGPVEFHGDLFALPHVEWQLDEPLPRELTDGRPPHIF
ncbi:hypothetical protein PQQ88_11895 [Paraburkholderia caledonica]|jgi:hypothetical protein|uniref:Uncharacterized protein n=2 Tax=Paraburkholderia TaxID=1822464 RepID=A0AB73I5R0_9BURK|nr:MULTISPECIES: hypothetical protein [Paraburkholderia]OWJ63252.1 hypothetical protein BWU74_02380 [Burkholderia sp. Bk]MBT2790679.1 hypothetical protein [Paraburkholderia strydomiana]MDP9645232.1 hypothetical protein [Paraburkholderia caledonica]MDR6374865.1 hypothetical protein [Paraburkholderia caledonica]MDR7007947.1 hypothetical protein [Paraburkholderia strydomiana]